MNLETLFDANNIASELRQWNDIDLRLSLGDGFCKLVFVAYETKSMPNKYEKLIGTIRQLIRLRNLSSQ